MRSIFANDYCKSAWKEVKILEKMGARENANCTPDMNVLESTWAFNLKRFTSGLINNFKAR